MRGAPWGASPAPESRRISPGSRLSAWPQSGQLSSGVSESFCERGLSSVKEGGHPCSFSDLESLSVLLREGGKTRPPQHPTARLGSRDTPPGPPHLGHSRHLHTGGAAWVGLLGAATLGRPQGPDSGAMGSEPFLEGLSHTRPPGQQELCLRKAWRIWHLKHNSSC